MADSGITKRALAAALKSLLNEQPLEKISVSDICDICDMNRKSFYYHFHDKYELLNWIFDTEFSRLVALDARRSVRSYLSAMCEYLYENKAFYRKILRLEKQNPFAMHFVAEIERFFATAIKARCIEPDSSHPFYIRFYSNTMLCSLSYWLNEREPEKPADYVVKICKCVEIAAKII